MRKRRITIILAFILVIFCLVLFFINSYSINKKISKEVSTDQLEQPVKNSATDNKKETSDEKLKEATNSEIIKEAKEAEKKQEVCVPKPLERPVALRRGDKGIYVKEIQELLNKFGYKLKTDGIFGENTFFAVLSFQYSVKLQPDGLVGPKTLKELQKEPTRATMYTPKPQSNINYISKNNTEKYINSLNIKSPTNYLLWIDINHQKVHSFSGNVNNWKLIKSMSCSTGKASTPTVKGIFKVQDKGPMFRVDSRIICKYYTRFHGNYLFHTVLLFNDGSIANGTLGRPLSHGCVRLSIENAKYIYYKIPSGTTVLSR